MRALTPNISSHTNSILGIRLTVSHNYYLDCNTVIDWVEKSESKYICCANAHMLAIAIESQKFRDVLASADLITLDGRPVFWLIYIKNIFYYLLGYSPLKKHGILQFCGRDVMEQTIDLASNLSISIGFYGNKQEVLDDLISEVKSTHPDIKIDYVFSPPFRPLSIKEDEEIVSAINRANIGILFVSLGCPKQEYWMHKKKGIVKAVMIGVGGAFDVVSNSKPRPNRILQILGLEWLLRFLLEPKRLFIRNAYYSPKFVFVLLSRVVVKSVRHFLSKIGITFDKVSR